MVLLTDVLLRRQAEISQQLAALAGLHPKAVLPIIRRLPLDEVTDLRARRFITALLARWPEIEKADSEKQARIAVETAFGNGVATEFLMWISRTQTGGHLFEEVAAGIVREIKCLRITRATLENLQDYIAETQEIARND